MAKRITIKDLSEYLSLSTATVSRAFSGSRHITEETRRKVLDAAKELGYKPNMDAVNLKTRHIKTVGVILCELATDIPSVIIRGITNVLYANGIKVIIACSDDDPDREKENLLMMEKYGVDGIIISQCGFNENKEEYRRIMDQGTPMIFICRAVPDSFMVDRVMADEYTGVYFLMEKLILSGRKRICHIHGPKDLFNSEERAMAYRDALARYRIPYDENLQVSCGLELEDGVVAVDELVSRNIDFDAVFAFTDTVAVGALQRLLEIGYKVPEQIAIAGFAGNMLTTCTIPKLSTVSLPSMEIGRKAAELLLDKFSTPDAPCQKIVLSTKLILRHSTGI